MNSEIGRTSINEKVRMKLWGISAGRCEICNRLLYQDTALGVDGNFGENAHIHAVNKNGPRHKYGMTTEEKNDISNLMLLCAEHHHMIDTNPELFGASKLLKIRERHEQRIRNVTGIPDYQSCRMVSYFSNIDNQEIFSKESLFRQSLVASQRIPLQQPVIPLHKGMTTQYTPSRENFEAKALELEQAFKEWSDAIIKQEDSIAVFALAPQPLLIKLGTLINDQYNTEVFQCHREGHKWAWQDHSEAVEYIIKRPGNIANSVALVIDLSAEVVDDRIKSVLGEDSAIYHLTIPTPNRNFVRSRDIQSEFVKTFRVLLEEIKNLRPQPKIVHLFPVMPNSLAIRAGMDFMPKTDIPMLIYEQANARDGFFSTLTIGG